MSLPVRPAYRLYQGFWTGVDWLYPPRCGGCGNVGSRWCAKCDSDTIKISPPICIHCGIKVEKFGSICNRCQNSQPEFTMMRAWAVFTGPVRNALHRLKYHRDIALGEILARPMIRLIYEHNWKIDIISPVPLGVARRNERGYNQAALLAIPLALAFGWEYRPNELRRVKETRSQVGLSVNDRYFNVKDAFVGGKRLVDKHVLVVDDVATSGATVEACSRALRLAGAKEVYCITLARVI